ncbi:MAG TPA: DUF4390 domain-containing protein [Povalibacter sp.]|jgi:hypothetical protein|nr:DUF4390 domain-containing protein [Povalibacter sp.]
MSAEAARTQSALRVPAAFRWLLGAIALLIGCGLAWAQSAQRFEIRSAYIEPAEGVYQLNATLVFELPDGAREAVREGAPLTLDLEIVVHRSRRFWLDETVANLEQHYELVYHALSERFLLRNLNSGEQTSFATLDAALDSLRVIANLPILDQSLVVPDARHEISLRAHLDVRTMPDALRFIVFWANDWRQTTEWYTWSPQI